MDMVFSNQTIKNILNRYRKIWAVEYANGLLGWDREVYMPKMGALERGVANAELSMLAQKFILEEDFVNLVESVNVDELNDWEKGVIRVLKREIKHARAIPPEVIGEMSRVTSEASMAWREAREKNDFEKFKPYLEKIVVLSRKIADYLGYEEHPYDALADLFEEGYTVRDYDRFFEDVEKNLRTLLDKILDSGWPREHVLEKEKYDIPGMEKVNRKVLDIFGYPFETRARMDVSTHPFTMGLGWGDVRITTRYEGFDFRRSLLSTIHEFGHALYELQIAKEINMTPIAHGVSSGIHESQSRFWENIIGRSREFSELIHPVLKESLDAVKNYDSEEIYLYLNIVRPSFIRTEADEVTYTMHILLRYRLEKMMIAGEVNVADLPDLWNNQMEELLGIVPKRYSEGILQDIHWSGGMIGYFPTYALGTVLAAQIYHHIQTDIPEFHEHIRNGKFEEIKKYLEEKIHRFGKTYPPKELFRKSFGEEPTSKYFIEYIQKKYLS